MNPEHPAWRLAAAIHAGHGDADATERAFEELKPNAVTICQAYALCLTVQEFNPQSYRLILAARLQLELTQEHVAAQERMGRKLERLTRVLIVLTIALAVFGLADAGEKIINWLSGFWHWLVPMLAQFWHQAGAQTHRN